ncbi:hypothetical protein GCM10009828_062630 [Actinoplanes couchii]|uniref:Uncharacterized protein n=1 Tax=Actinoplanes couchii TaxID=403638 RepID=A0ABQ3X3N6_9ACTN|nr:hypothetical protein Aco03nite_015160 [Actinoplanes couchii]
MSLKSVALPLMAHHQSREGARAKGAIELTPARMPESNAPGGANFSGSSENHREVCISPENETTTRPSGSGCRP